jgi:hypothetical protein
MQALIPKEIIESKIFLIRGDKVMIDKDLALLYGVETRGLIQAIKRNKDRFPKDFMFQLSKKEYKNLRSQTVISSWGGRRFLPYAFTEQGVAMLSSVLNSKRAILMNIQIMRIFVKIRKIINENKVFSDELMLLKTRIDQSEKEIKSIFEVMKQLTTEQAKPKRKVGFYY